MHIWSVLSSVTNSNHLPIVWADGQAIVWSSRAAIAKCKKNKYVIMQYYASIEVSKQVCIFDLSSCLSSCLSASLLPCLPAHLVTCLPACLSLCLSVLLNSPAIAYIETIPSFATWSSLCTRDGMAWAGEITRVCQIPLPTKWTTDWQVPCLSDPTSGGSCPVSNRWLVVLC